MGEPNHEIEYGSDCLLCYPTGKTPGFFAATFSGIQKGNLWIPSMPGPGNGTYLLVKNGTCGWHYEPGNPLIVYSTTIAASGLSLEWGPGVTPFVGYDSESCILLFDNQIDTPVNTYYYGGTGVLIPSGQLSFYNYAGGFYPIAAAKNEQLTDEPTKQVIRTVNESDHTNFKIKEVY